MIALPLFMLLLGQTPGEPRAPQLEACVAREIEQARDGAACVGLLSGPCQDQPGGSSTSGMIACLGYEGMDWTSLLNDALRRAQADPDLEPAAKRALARSQADWRRGMERSLAVYDGRDGTFWPVAKEGMRTDWIARRYLWVRGLTGPL